MLIIQASLEKLGHWMYGSTFSPQGESDSWDFSSPFGMLSKGEDLWCLLAQGVTFILLQATRLCQTPLELQDWQDRCQFFRWSQRSQVIGHTDHLFPSPGGIEMGFFHPLTCAQQGEDLWCLPAQDTISVFPWVASLC